MKDLHNNIKPEVAFNTRTLPTNTTTNGNIIDMKGFDSLEFILLSGVLTDGSYVPLIEEGDASDLSDASAVADADLLGTESEVSYIPTDDIAKKIGYIGNKRYVRLSIVTTSISSGGVMSAIAIKGHATNRPVG